MTRIAILLTDAEGEVQSANPAAIDALGPALAGRCDALLGAQDGGPVCRVGCAASFAPGEQRDHGVVKVRGRRVRLICSAVGGARVVTLQAATEASPGEALSEREQEVLRLVARGFTSAAIGERLGITAATVRCHVEHIRGKLRVHTRSQAVARAMLLGLIE